MKTKTYNRVKSSVTQLHMHGTKMGKLQPKLEKKKKLARPKVIFQEKKMGKIKKLGSYIYKYKNLFQIDQRPK